MKNAASAPEKKTPGHALMRGGGVIADRKIKLSSGARGPQWAWSLLTEQQETPAVALPLTPSLPAASWKRAFSPMTCLIWDN